MTDYNIEKRWCVVGSDGSMHAFDSEKEASDVLARLEEQELLLELRDILGHRTNKVAAKVLAWAKGKFGHTYKCDESDEIVCYHFGEPVRVGDRFMNTGSGSIYIVRPYHGGYALVNEVHKNKSDVNRTHTWAAENMFGGMGEQGFSRIIDQQEDDYEWFPTEPGTAPPSREALIKAATRPSWVLCFMNTDDAIVDVRACEDNNGCISTTTFWNGDREDCEAWGWNDDEFFMAPISKFDHLDFSDTDKEGQV